MTPENPPPPTNQQPQLQGGAVWIDGPGQGRACWEVGLTLQYFHSALGLRGKNGILLKASLVIARGIKLNQANHLPEVIHLQPPKNIFGKKIP